MRPTSSPSTPWPTSWRGTAASRPFSPYCRSSSTSCRSRLPNPEGASGDGTARRTVSALIGILVAAGLLYWALRGVRLSEVVFHLRAARSFPLALAAVLATATFPLRLVRWRLLLRDERGAALPAVPLWHAVAIGFMANNLLPFRPAELVR